MKNKNIRRLTLACVVGMFFILTTSMYGITVHPGHYDMNLAYGTSGVFESSGYVIGTLPDDTPEDNSDNVRTHQGGVQVLDKHHVITTFHG